MQVYTQTLISAGAATAVGGIDIVRGGCSELDEAYHWRPVRAPGL